MAYEDSKDPMNQESYRMIRKLQQVPEIYEWYKDIRHKEGWSFLDTNYEPQTLCAKMKAKAHTISREQTKARNSGWDKDAIKLYGSIDKGEKLVIEFKDTCLELFGEDPLVVYAEWKENNERR